MPILAPMPHLPPIPFAAALAAVPWLLAPFVAVWRLRGTPTLADESDSVPRDAPLVSVIIPARDEARNIARCVRSVLATRYPALEVIVVDDHSRDDTAAVVEAIARDDGRLALIRAAALPAGWFGKQWACATGVAAAHGTVLCFTDADTVHAPDLLVRVVNAMRRRNLVLVSVGGRQELDSFWECVVQPQMFALLAGRFGGPGEVNRSRRAADKLANGQYIAMMRTAYDSIGGHAAVRDKVAEDVALARLAFERGLRTELVLALPQLSTRMYASLGEIVRGWGKNIYAGALDVMPGGRAGRALLPALLVLAPLAALVPPLSLLAAFAGWVLAPVGWWALIATIALLVPWAIAYPLVLGRSPLYALTVPLGAAVVLWIALGAIARGRRVEWKGRAYEAG